jgi:hypothetical protein
VLACVQSSRCTGDAEVGDKLVVAKGGRVPLVLRGDGGTQYRLVGEAYAHGIMNGEEFEEDRCVEIKIH